MTNKNFEDLRQIATKRRFEMCDRKSVSYTRGSDDRLANFKELAKLMPGYEPSHVLAVYIGKHYLAFSHWLSSGEESSEGIESTIDDLQNYLDLARAMYLEEREVSLVQKLDNRDKRATMLSKELDDEDSEDVDGGYDFGDNLGWLYRTTRARTRG
jgi:hypothetical protein